MVIQRGGEGGLNKVHYGLCENGELGMETFAYKQKYLYFLLKLII